MLLLNRTVKRRVYIYINVVIKPYGKEMSININVVIKPYGKETSIYILML